MLSHGKKRILPHESNSEFLSRQWCEDRVAEEGAKPSMANKGKADSKPETGANLGFEAKLWQMADGLRNNMDAAEYKHVVLGLIFLKYISDAFEAKHAELETQRKKGADPEDPDEYKAASIFWVPKEARWSYLKAKAPQPTIGTLVDDAMAAIERDNPSLKTVLPKDFGRVGLDKIRLGQIINLVSDIALGHTADRAKDSGFASSWPPTRRWCCSTGTSAG
jgi:type I restriction enzyme M protein